MRLLARSMVVAIIPLCCQIAVAGWLGVELKAAYQKLEAVSRSKEVVSQTLEVVRKVTTDYSTINMNSEVDDLFDPETTRKCCADLRDRVKAIASLVVDDPMQRANINNLSEASEEFIRLLEWALAQQRMGRHHWVQVNEQCYESAYRVFNKFIVSTQAIVATEQTRVNLSGQLQQSGQRILTLLAITVPFNIVLALLLSRIWSQSIAAPLLRVRQNSRLLSLQKPLLPALTGDDELAVLDRQLHQVAAAVYQLLGTERSLIANAAEMICTLDKEGNVVEINDSASTLLVKGRSLLDFTTVDDRVHADTMLRAACVANEPIRFELRMQDSAGTVIESQWSVLWSEFDQLMFCVAKDVTEERKIERLKDDFIELISHNLKAPLLDIEATYQAGCRGERGILPEAALKEFSSCQKIVKRLLRLVDNLLDFRLIESGKLELVLSKVDLLDIAREAVSLVEGVASVRSIRIECFDKSLIVWGDKDKLLQTVLNLLSNAIKFSPDGGRIKIEGRSSNRSVSIHVIDQGVGVPAQKAAEIFKPFVQDENARHKEGVGLGLAICQMIVQAHHGEIGVDDSLTGSGADFWFALPRQSIR